MTTDTTQATARTWTLDNGGSDAWGVFSADGDAICYLSENATNGHGLNDNDQANAHLIVTAVNCHEDLLAACELIAESDCGHSDAHKTAIGYQSGMSAYERLKVVRAAIAKVKEAGK